MEIIRTRDVIKLHGEELKRLILDAVQIQTGREVFAIDLHVVNDNSRRGGQIIGCVSVELKHVVE
jgi:hypothetical protein